MNDFTVDIERKLSRLGRDIQEFVEKIIPLQDPESDFSPDCDIVESGGEFRILMDLPGLEKKEIRVSLKDQVLRISGERVLQTAKGEKMKRRERKAGSFSRSFAIPEQVDASGAAATFKNGVLIVSMPKSGIPGDAQSIPVN